ncbi:golgin subfamily A member 3-like [Gossypium australe]|uniref:Golgin subfamily A member 3-like n=1 Tax=Gossypium australe TaxID=47621 RepID=A0A5B6VE21_9ROSI|nr:golgin subfamily A member 3-like [Gossypium australe]
MKESETVKQYSDRIMAIVNSIRLLGNQFSKARIVEKVISTLLERYGAKISSLEDSRDLSSISLTELIMEFMLKNKRESADRRSIMKMGHVEKVCKNKGQHKQHQPQQPKIETQVAEETCAQEEQVFVVSCSTNRRKITKGYLIDNGCTNHMTPDTAIFKNIDKTFNSREKVGNGQYIKAEGKEDVLIDTASSKECLISDPNRSKLMSVAMADRSIVADWNKRPVNAYTIVLDESKLWHRRLDHVNYMSLLQLSK